jgi:hypothetical protein
MSKPDAAITVGTQVTWKASGKGARVDGVAGRMVTGTVTELVTEDVMVRGEWVPTLFASIRGDYRSMFSGHLVAVERLRPLR